jgi:hypothetical protein
MAVCGAVCVAATFHSWRVVVACYAHVSVSYACVCVCLCFVCFVFDPVAAHISLGCLLACQVGLSKAYTAYLRARARGDGDGDEQRGSTTLELSPTASSSTRASSSGSGSGRVYGESKTNPGVVERRAVAGKAAEDGLEDDDEEEGWRETVALVRNTLCSCKEDWSFNHSKMRYGFHRT